jgi:SEC-C motif-containing protein
VEGGRRAGGGERSETQVTQPVVSCPCGGAAYAQCCGRFHAGAVPDTAEQLMRARYSAYALGLMGYVHRTWHTSTRPAREELTADATARWLGLGVKKHVQDGDAATVEFVARYKIGGRAYRLHEVSRFVREDGKWFYVDGKFPDNSTI